jgi:integrase
LIYQISGQRKYYAIPESSILPVYWDAEGQKVKFVDGKTVKQLMPDAESKTVLLKDELNQVKETLDGIRIKVQAIENSFLERGIPFSAQMVVDRLKEGSRLQTKKDESSTFLFEFMDRYINDHQGIREKGSLSVYHSLKNHLKAYEQQTAKKVSFLAIDYGFFKSFQNFLIKHRQLNNTTVAKQLSTVKTFLNYARLHGIEVPDGYKDFKIKREPLEVVALTLDEFETLFNMDLSNNLRLDKVRDIFCFSCATGLRFSDLDQLKREHIKNGEIRLTVKKTKELLSIPLNTYSASILAKYQEQLAPLPMISNQKMNAYLKGWDDKNEQTGTTIHHPGLCEIAGINEPVEIVRFRGAVREAKILPKFKLIGVHTGRKTFATLSLEKGMSAEETMAITGHKDYKSFKRYVKVTEQRKKVVMGKAWGQAKPLSPLRKAE